MKLELSVAELELLESYVGEGYDSVRRAQFKASAKKEAGVEIIKDEADQLEVLKNKLRMVLNEAKRTVVVAAAEVAGP